MTPPVVIPSLAAARSYQGTELGTTEWLTITQERIDLFAHATGDTRWIHIDSERAARESPWKSTIADGYLLLSLVPDLLARLVVVVGWETAVNLGVDGCEFPGVATAGSRVRLGARLARTRLLPGQGGRLESRPTRSEPEASGGGPLPGQGCRIDFDVWFDVEGNETPACRARVNCAYFE